MNERLEAMKQSVLASLRRARIFYSAHRGLLLSGLTILSILLIVWARFGFTLQFSQFFAYQGGGECLRAGNTFCKNGDVWEWQDESGTCVSSLYEDCVAPKTCVANGTSASCQAASTPTPTPTGGGGGPTPTPTPTGGGVCADNTNCSACSGVTQARKDCEGNNTTTRNGIGKNDGTESCSWWRNYGQNFCTTCPYLYQTAKAPKGAAAGDNSVATWAAAGVSKQNLCQEKPDDCPSGWHAWSSSWCEQNATAPPATPTPTPTPTATKTPTPSPTVSPTVTPTATATASATPVPTTTATLSPSPTTTATTMPAPILAYSIGVSGRNVTVTSVQASSVQLQVGQQAEVIIAVRNTSYTQNSTAGALAPLSNVVVRAVLPTGLEYIAESTSVSGVPTTIDSITTGGLALGTIAPQQEVAVVFRIRAVTSQFVVGTTQTSIVVSATVANANQQTATLPVTVTRATAGVPGTVKTGPGDAVLVALLMSAIVTLLYVSYTHTSAYKRKEIEAITQGRDPMDFRS